MVYVISYDVADDNTRNRVSKTLDDFGTRVQKSVFECNLTAEQFASLLAQLSQTRLGELDSIRLYTLCKECCGKVKILGIGELTHDEEVYVV